MQPISVNREEFQNALTSVKDTVTQSALCAWGKYVSLKFTIADNRLRVATMDEGSANKAYIMAAAHVSTTPSDCLFPLVDYKLLTKLIASLTADVIEIRSDFTHSSPVMYIKNGKKSKELKLIGFDPTTFPIDNNLGNPLLHTLVLNAGEFIDAVNAIKHVSNNNSDESDISNCISFEFNNDTVECQAYSTQTQAMAYYKRRLTNVAVTQPFSMFLDTSKIKTLLNKLDRSSSLKLQIHLGYVQLETENYSSTVRFINGTFPPISIFFKVQYAGYSVLQRQELLNSLSRVMLLSNGVNIPIFIQVTPSMLVIDFENVYGQIYEEISCTTKASRNFVAKVNVKTLYDLLQYVNFDNITLAYPASNSLIIRPSVASADNEIRFIIPAQYLQNNLTYDTPEDQVEPVPQKEGE